MLTAHKRGFIDQLMIEILLRKKWDFCVECRTASLKVQDGECWKRQQQETTLAPLLSGNNRKLKSSLYSSGLQSPDLGTLEYLWDVVERENCIRCAADKSSANRVMLWWQYEAKSEECFKHLVEIMPRRIECNQWLHTYLNYGHYVDYARPFLPD